jgi:hypothetical protein
MRSEIEIPVFKISASQCGKIMTETAGKSIRQRLAELSTEIEERTEKLKAIKPTLKTYEKAVEMLQRRQDEFDALLLRENEPNLSKTCITYLRKWVDEKIYRRKVEFTSKQTDKGNLVEDDSINYASIHLGWGLVSKNLERLSNDFAHGEPDLILQDEVPDIKSSWTHDTFPLYSPELEEKDYEWQDLVYQWLSGKHKGRIVFVLTSMPEEMIRKEARWKLPTEYTEQEFNEFAAQFRYDDLEPYLRLKEYEVVYDEDKIRQIESRVIECRKYIETVILPEVEKNFRKYQSIKA